MLENDVILSKISIIKNCINTIHKATTSNPKNLDDMIIQDVFVLNLQRAIQAAIDIANVLISEFGWKLPTTYRESFIILKDKKVVSRELCDIMIKMVGFRNIAVHNYQQLNVDVLKSILSHHIKDLEQFYSAVFQWLQSNKNV